MDGYDDIRPSPVSIPRQDYRESPQRYAVLFIYCYLSAVSAMVCYSFFSITEAVNTSFGVVDRDIETLGIVFTLITVPLYLPSAYLLDKFGLRYCLMGGSGLTAMAASARLAAPTDFLMLYVTLIMAGCAYPIIQAAPATVGALWFKASNRTLAVSLAAISCSMGIIAAFWIPNSYVSGYESNEDECPDKIENLIFLEAGLAFVGFLMTIAFIQDRPNVPPSPTVAMRRVIDFKESIMMLVTSRNYLKVLFLTSVIVGVGHAFSVIIDPLFKKMQISRLATRESITLCMAFGLLGSIVWGYVVDTAKTFKPVIVSLSTACFATLMFASFMASHENESALVVGVSLAGFTGIASVGLLFDLASEVCYPVSEAISTAMIFMSSLAVASVLMVMAQALMDCGNSELVLPAFMVIYFVAILIYSFSKETLNRTKADHALSNSKYFGEEEAAHLLSDEE